MTLEIAPFERADFASLLGWFSNEAELVQWAGPFIRPPLDESKLDVMLAEVQTALPVRLGWTGLMNGGRVAHAQLVLEPSQGVARLARVAVAPECRGRGLAVPFLRRVLAEAFAMSWLERLELNVRADNLPALRTYAALGFLHEGTRRSAVPVGGERWDIAIQSVLRAEYAAGYSGSSPSAGKSTPS